MSKAWVTREWIDADGKRKRAKCDPGVKGIGKADSFVVEYLDPTGKRRREKIGIRGKPGKNAGDDRADAITASILAGTYEAKNRSTWAEFRAEFESKVMAGMEPGTAMATRIALDHFQRIVNPVRMESITSKTFADYVAKRRQEPRHKPSKRRKADADAKSEPVSKATVNKELRHLKAVLRKAHKWGFIDRMPDIELLKVTQRIPAYVPPEHFAAMYDACDVATRPSDVPNVSPAAWWRALLMVAYTTGWRIGELLTLAWANVDLDAGTVFLAGDDNKGRRDEFIPLPPIAIEHLAGIKTFETLVFPWESRRRDLWEEFGRIQAKAGVKPDRARPGRVDRYGFHDLRRGFGTMNADRMSGDALQRMMRHRNYATTQMYINLSRQMRSAAEDVFVPEVSKTGSGN